MAHIRSRKHPAPSHLLALMAAAIPVAVHAQEAEKTLPAMTVTADVDVPFKAEKSANTKFTQPLLDTPQTVQVIKKEILQEQGAATLMEALRNTPGITMQLGENGNTAAGDAFSMRGFSTEGATFVDGIRDLGAVTRDVFNVEQVEVVKGPAGSDIGRGSQSGYINLISKLPQAGDINNASVAVGTDEYKRITADLNKQVGDNLAFRLNVMGQDADVAGRDYVHNRSFGVAPSLAWGLNSPTRFYLFSQHVRQDNVPDGGIPTVGMPGFYNAVDEVRGAPKVNRENFYGNHRDYEKVDADMVTAKVEHDFGGGTVLRNVTRYGRTKMDRRLTGINAITAANPADPSSWVVAQTRQGIDRINEIAANQTSLNMEFNTGAITHTLVTGLEFMYERQRDDNFCTTKGGTRNNCLVAQTLVAPTINLYAPNPAVELSELQKTGAYTDGNTTTAALYAFDTLKLSERWMLSGGVRFERYRTSTESATVTAAGALVQNDNLRVSDNLFSWKLGAVYKPATNGSIYAAYAKSLTPPGSASFALSSSASSANGTDMKAQETVNMELGTKWELLDKRLNVSSAIYRTENENQVSLVDAVTNTYAQQGKTRVDGIELSAVGQLTNFWQVSAGVARMWTKQLSQYGTAGAQSSGVRWAPDLTATLWTSYTLGDFTLGGGVRYVSEQKRVVTDGTNLATENMPKIPSYWVTDLMAAYKVSKNLNLRLNVYNLFDKEYISTLNNSGARATLGAPRTAILSANFQF